MKHQCLAKIITLVILTLALLVGGCAGKAAPAGPSGPSGTTEPAGAATPAGTTAKEVSVTISGFAYSQQTIQVVPGTTVKWTNLDSVTHHLTTTKPPGLFDSGPLARGDTFSYTFNEPGTFEYRCIPHPSMTGKIIVK